MLDYTAFLSARAASGALLVLGATTIAVWATRTARPQTAEADDATTLPKLPGDGAEKGGLAAVAFAAIVTAVATTGIQALRFGWLMVLGLVLAAAIRGYRLRRPGPPVLDRLAAVLAVVPGCALLAGAIYVLIQGSYSGRDLAWVLGHAVAGALALIVGLRWKRAAGA
ncbi:hypothetical protein ABT369_00620 [Dactylosporangium sp. NPDC000244]|uniref:hypothetical protein n=1 Tax=Dactylosporangium sp. NPDC000244 TaxID=3154365 RepID=UPI00331D75D3